MNVTKSGGRDDKLVATFTVDEILQLMTKEALKATGSPLMKSWCNARLMESASEKRYGEVYIEISPYSDCPPEGWVDGPGRVYSL